MATAEATAIEAPVAVCVAAGEALDLLAPDVRDALAARDAVAELAALAAPLGGHVAALALLVAKDLDVHDHGGREAHRAAALCDLEDILGCLGLPSRSEDVASFNFDDVLPDVTVTTDFEEVTAFLDTTPRLPLRVIVDGALAV